MSARSQRRVGTADELSLARERKLEFRQMCDALAEALGIPVEAVSRAFGVDPGAIARWRDNRCPDPPPDEWRATLASLGRELVAERRRQVADGELLVELLREP